MTFRLTTRIKSLPIKIGVFFTSLAISLLAAEMSLRFINYADSAHPSFHLKNFWKFDEKIGWDGRPNIEGFFRSGKSSSYVKQNDVGYRGRGYPIQRSNKVRLLMLGDSFVWGYGVDETNLFSERLEKMFGKSHDIINMGVCGYGTDQELLLWQTKGYRWKPDAVYLFFCVWNDVAENLSSNSFGYPKPYFRKNKFGQYQIISFPKKNPNPRGFA